MDRSKSLIVFAVCLGFFPLGLINAIVQLPIATSQFIFLISCFDCALRWTFFFSPEEKERSSFLVQKKSTVCESSFYFFNQLILN